MPAKKKKGKKGRKKKGGPRRLEVNIAEVEHPIETSFKGSSHWIEELCRFELMHHYSREMPSLSCKLCFVSLSKQVFNETFAYRESAV